MNAEWVPKTAFAECAEALGISTTEVFAAKPTPDGFVVIYTPGVTEENVEEVEAYTADLRRDADGILCMFGTPTPIPDFFAALQHGLASALRDDYEEEENDGTR